MSSKTLLKGGTALVHNDQDHVTATKTDILIQGSKISRLAPDIPSSEAEHILDCTDKIITPGFIDTHHHVWQTQLKGKHAHQTLLEYLPQGNFTSSCYHPDDVFWGQLGGALEAIEGGITTLVDHAHINYSPEHTYAALRATLASGIRSIFGYCPTPRAEALEPFSMAHDFFPPWVMDTFEKLAAANPMGDGRVLLGFAFDGLFLPKEMLQPIFKRVFDAGAHLYTVHDSVGPMFGNRPSAFYTLKSLELLDPKRRTIISHANGIQSDSGPELVANNVSISNTPSSELQMGMANAGRPLPVCFTDPALSPSTSIGVDCHSIGSAFIPSQLRELLAATRIFKHEEDHKDGKWHRSLAPTKPGDGFPSVEQAFNAATLGGARAVGLADKIGRIKEGYSADLVVWEGTSPSMVAVAEEDPIAAVVLHSSIRDVSGVIIDGTLRKWEGRLLDVNLDNSGAGPLAGYKLPDTGLISWPRISQRIRKSRHGIMQKMDGIDFRAAEDTLMNIFYCDQGTMI